MLKGFKIRIYPTKEQEELIYKHINQCRFIWNYMLAYCNDKLINKEIIPKKNALCKKLTQLKHETEYSWLYDCANSSYQIVCKDLSDAFERMFLGLSNNPKFKLRKKQKLSYPTTGIYFRNNSVHIKILGNVKYKTDFELPQGTQYRENTFQNSKIYNKLGKWFLTFSMECENQVLPLTESNVGIDLGIKELAVCAYNDVPLIFHNINKSKKVKDLQKRINDLQRSISRKYEQNKQENIYIKTNNIVREKEKLRKLYAKISNINDNYIHQITAKIIKLLPKRVIMEGLNVRGIMKNHHLSKAIQEQNFHKFIIYMKYKCDWNGIEFIQVDRFYPSSKTCSNCGNIKSDLKLSDRIYKCECGLEIDRDFNAALNLSRYVI